MELLYYFQFSAWGKHLIVGQWAIVCLLCIEVKHLWHDLSLTRCKLGRVFSPERLPAGGVCLPHETADSIQSIYNDCHCGSCHPGLENSQCITFKIGKRHLNGYRPIRLITRFSNGLQEILKARITKEIRENSKWTKHTLTVLSKANCIRIISHVLTTALDKGTTVDLTYLDVRQASDSVSPRKYYLRQRRLQSIKEV